MGAWTSERFEKYRMLADPIADRTVRDIIEIEGKEGINKLFGLLRSNGDFEHVDLPEPVLAYFQATKDLPISYDPALATIGERVFARYGPQISLCLLCKSLPEAYACAKGAKVLYSTGRLLEHKGSLSVFTRRLMETAQFVMYVCEPGGISKNGKGIITAQKVRLIHASIRYYLHKYGWDLANGEPINQQDMAGTLQSFSTLILQGLTQLKIQLSEEEKAGYYHVWHMIGYVMGVHPDLNPSNHTEGFELGTAILNDQIAPSKEGVELTKAVYEFIDHTMPGNIFGHIPEAMIRYLTGDKIADILSVRTSSELQKYLVPKFLGDLFHSHSEASDLDHFYQKLFEKLNEHFLQSILMHYNEDKQVRFYIPPSLKEDWKL